MIPGLYQSAGGLMTQMENHQVISENLGASAVPGFRRNVATFESFLPAPSKANQVPSKAGDVSQVTSMAMSPSIPNIKTSTDFTTGQLQKDGCQTHFAISGPGFFAVENADGNPVYTKNGSFTINSQKELCTDEGWKVLSPEGSPITIQKPSVPFFVSETAEIYQEGVRLGKLQMAKFADPKNDLEWLGGRFFASKSGAPAESDDPSSQMMQGYLEGSNVSVVHEMVSMIQAMRLYEANQKMLQSQDSTLEQTIRQVPSR